MDDPYDLVIGMFALAIAAVMLVAGELYLVTRLDPPETYVPPPSVVTSSINRYLKPNHFGTKTLRHELSNRDEEVGNGRLSVCSDAVARRRVDALS
jgi:hypothetical protein